MTALTRRHLLAATAATAAVAAMPAASAAAETPVKMLAEDTPRKSGKHLLSKIVVDAEGRPAVINIWTQAFADVEVGDVVDAKFRLLKLTKGLTVKEFVEEID